MAERPWVLPKEIKAYTDIEAVQQRKKDKLEMDIARAEQYVITYTHNRFEGYDKIPGPVRTAVILLAEAYASYANQLKKTGGGAVKSETFDDYSYTAGEGVSERTCRSYTAPVSIPCTVRPPPHPVISRVSIPSS